MDFVSHALAGAATGYAFGHPVAGAVLGVLPDAVLGIRRRGAPNCAYNATHSLTFIVACGAIACPFGWGAFVMLSLSSHIILDLPTHGEKWAPVLLYPFSKKRFSFGEEWEWFSPSWWFGLGVTLAWSTLWIL